MRGNDCGYLREQVWWESRRRGLAGEVWLEFLSSSGGFWRQGSGAYGADSISLDTWHRVGLVVSDRATLDIYVDGVLVANNLPWDDGDSIYTVSSPDPTFGGGSFSLLGDSDGFHGLGYLANLAFFNAALGADEMETLGTASSEGIWLYLRGDANGDDAVTGADYTLWADSFGKFPGNADNSNGDFNGDGFVTGADYTIWADHFGRTRFGAESWNLPLGVSPVPEPSAFGLWAFALLFLVRCRRSPVRRGL